MKKSIVFAALIMTFAGAAYADSLAEKTGVNSALNISPSTGDFVRDAAIGGMFEIQSSQLAKEKASGATVTFADTMIKDHTKADNELKALVRSGAVEEPLPTALDSSHQKMLDQLKGESGADFARTYADDQVSAHKDAVSLFERYAKGGDNDALKQWASKTLPILRHHLSMAEDLRQARVAEP